ncbi:AAA family ATPase [Methanolobus sp. ZRKC3]|uniref:AAA family ATPase n=1 Tax=Methanolobus sp. ZRKC3 TaxID=3125786 RepID=UPI0032466F52
MDGYNSSFEHLLEELSRIDLIVRTELNKFRENQHCMNDFRGLYISEDEIDEILQDLNCGFKADKDSNVALEQIKEISLKIDAKKNESIRRGTELRLQSLSELFHLDSFELDVLLICLASELDLQYEKLYSYLQNDVTKKRPSVDLVMKLLSFSKEDKFRAREYFFPEAPLIMNLLIHLTNEGSHEQLPLLSRLIKLDEGIINFLMGFDEIDFRLKNFSSIIEPKKSFNDLILVEDENEILSNITSKIRDQQTLILLFHGPYGTGKKTTAETICNESGKKLLIIDSSSLLDNEAFEILDIILREAILQNLALYFENFDELLENKDSEISRIKIIQKLAKYQNLIFLSTKHPWEPRSFLKNAAFINYPFSIPSFTTRKHLWDMYLENDWKQSDDLDISALASKFNFSGGQIRDAIFTASNLKIVRDTNESNLSMEDLFHGCKAQSNKKLSTLARKINSHYKWDDIILARDTKEQLIEVCGFIKYKGTVYNEWGFHQKLSLGKGLNILFSGPSGTGKTMAAEIIAKEVELDLYKIDLSSVVSKYIGETEKNLKKIFKEAETSNAILLFDEADAIFGKRSEVKDSHDRYANIETNYLLQKMEEHEGIVILASNFRKNMDEAFLRRLQFTIEFPFPDEDSREIIWRNIFPKQTPLGNDVDFKFLSKFKITGGNIKNIALSAAFLAASDSGVVEMKHIIKTTKREFQKMGKLCNQSDFGIYYDLVK